MNRNAFRSVFIPVLLLVGCGSQARLEAERQAAVAAQAEADAAQARAAKSAGERRQRFECELLVAHRTVGGAGTSSHRATWHDGGRPFTAVENYSTTIKGEGRSMTFRVRYKEQRDGKDVYEVTATEQDAKGERATTTDKAYEGKPLVVFESAHATLTLQPPTDSK